MVGDPQKQFRLLQKEAQRTFIAMADLLKQGETTYQLIKSQVSYPGGREEKHQPRHSQQASIEDDPILPSGQNSIHWLQLPYRSKVTWSQAIKIVRQTQRRFYYDKAQQTGMLKYLKTRVIVRNELFA